MNAFFYPLKRGFYFAEIQGGKVTAYTTLGALEGGARCEAVGGIARSA